jgi:hypothetical protein
MTINAAAAAARTASKHVLYEIEMFCSLASYFENGRVDDAVRDLQHEGLVVRNAMIEAFQLHARQLIDLFTGRDSRDMSASDFTATKPKLKRTSGQEADFERFSQRVMHLSLNRAKFTAAEQRVDTRRIRLDLGDDIRRFLDDIDEGKVCDDFLARAHLALTLSEPRPEQLHAVVGATEALSGPTGGAVIPELLTAAATHYGGGTATTGLPPNPTP